MQQNYFQIIQLLAKIGTLEFAGGSITVQLTSCLTGLHSTKHVNILAILANQST